MDFATYYVEAASEEEAISIFEQKFDQHPDYITCSCCGEDYSIATHESLEQMSGHDRKCKWVMTATGVPAYEEEPSRPDCMTLEQYKASGKACFIEQEKK